MRGNGRHNRYRPVGLVALFALIGPVWILTAAGTGTPGAAQQGTLPWKPAPGTEDQYVGSETCAICHDTMAESFAANPHAGATGALGLPSGDITCEACHGAGTPHVDADGDPERIERRFAGMSAAEVGQACLACHAGSRERAHAAASTHAAADVACSDCHSIHGAERPDVLLKDNTPDLCYQCHQDVKASFMAADRHDLEKGLVSCESCHTPHGSSEPAMLARPMVNGELCSICHLDKRGPFVYEHSAVTVEGCVACHSPHGSPNRFMLKTNDVAGLCISCHPGALTVHNLTDARFQVCTTCHVAIHGSDTHRLFFRP